MEDRQMIMFFIGLIFIFFNFTFHAGDVGIGLIPDFIGYLLILLGFRQLRNHSMHFRKPQVLTAVMIGYSVIDYVVDLCGFESSWNPMRIIMIVLGVFALFAEFYITYEMVLGIKEAEFCTGINMRSAALLSIWKFWAAAAAAAYLMGWIPFLNTAAFFVAFVADLCFLIVFVGLTKLKG